MKNIEITMKKHYEIDVVAMSSQAGGWASLAYQLLSDEHHFFLKVYEKNRRSTAKLIERIEQYVPIMHWIVDNSTLSGKVMLPYLTKDGAYKCEDDEAVYLLYDYIDGTTIGDQSLSSVQIDQLSEIVAILHSYGSEIPFDTDAIKEDFHVPYARLIKDMVNSNIPQRADNISEIVYPYISRLSDLVSQVRSLAYALKNRQIRMALCHTDLHKWNLMQSKGQIVLIDWEGLKLAPVEADLFFLIDQPYFARFIDIYRHMHGRFQPDDIALQFYQGRRKLEDIGEYIEQLLFDPLDHIKRASVVSSLSDELEMIN